MIEAEMSDAAVAAQIARTNAFVARFRAALDEAMHAVDPSRLAHLDPDLLSRLISISFRGDPQQPPPGVIRGGIVGDGSDDDADEIEAEVETPVRQAGLFTKREAAAHLNVTDDQLAGFVRDGALPYINVGLGGHHP
jgi:hypothetical protein